MRTTTMTKKKRKYTAEFKVSVVDDLNAGRATYSELTRRHKLGSSQIHEWRKNVEKLRAQLKPAQNAHSRIPRVIADKNGRYTPEQKQQVLQLLANAKYGDVQRIARETGVHTSTLSAWKRDARHGSSTALVPVNGQVVEASPVQQQLHQINVSEAIANLTKGKRDAFADFRAGVINDFDTFHLRSMLALKMLTGQK